MRRAFMGYMSSRQNIAIYYMLISMFAYTVEDTFIKFHMVGISAVEVMFFRDLFSIFLILFISSRKHPILKRQKRLPKLLIVRGIFGFISGITFLYCLKHMTFVNAVAFAQSSAFFSSIIAFFVLKELLSKRQSLSIVVGLVGIVFIVFSDISIDISKNNIIGLVCMFSGACTFVSIHALRSYYDIRIIILTVLVADVLFCTLGMIIAEFYTVPALDFIISKFVMPDFLTMLFFVALSILHVGAQVYRTRAYMHGKAGIVGGAGYSRVIFALFAGAFLGESFPELYGFVGIFLIILGGFMAAYFIKKQPIVKKPHRIVQKWWG